MRAFFLRVSPALHVFPGGSLFLAILLSWRFAFPGNSSVLAVRVSWRFPCPGDSRLAIPNMSCLAGHGLVVLQLTQSRFLVAFGAPTPSSFYLQIVLRVSVDLIKDEVH